MLTTKKAIRLSSFYTRKAAFVIAVAMLAGCSGGHAPSGSPVVAEPVSAPPPPPSPPPGGGNHPPEISGAPPPSVEAGQTYSFTPTASDADNDALAFTALNVPAWAQFSSETGVLTGAPGDADVGDTQEITITVSDGHDSRSVGPFVIRVHPRNAAPGPANTPPTISGSPAVTATVNQTYSFTPSAADADGDSLSFAISNRPSWASFNASTGRFSGAPTNAHVGRRYSNITISVTDGRASAALPAFAIEVRAAANSAPTISGAPATSITAGLSYDFRPNGSDPDGDTLTYSIQNRPSWASFDSSTGRLYGAPLAAHVGSYANIAIEVSDGAARASLPSFAITVRQPAIGSALLSWTAPTQNTDGTALTDLAGFRIRYGRAASVLDEVIEIATPGMTTYVVPSLDSGTWYFTVEAYNAVGQTSEPSSVVSKTIS
jgi:hypothetical protein